MIISFFIYFILFNSITIIAVDVYRSLFGKEYKKEIVKLFHFVKIIFIKMAIGFLQMKIKM